MEYKGIYIATPRHEWPNPRYWHGLMALQAWASSKRIHWGFSEVCDKNGVSDNHNTLIQNFLEKDFEWMFMLDSDAMLHPMSLERMLSWDKKLVVPLMFRKVPPYLPTIFQEPLGPVEEDTWKQDFRWIHGWLQMHYDQVAVMDQPVLLNEARGYPLVEAQRAGTHVALVHRDVIEAIEPPWFEPKKESGSGSDFVFFRKALEAGFKLYCDLSVLSGHLQGNYCVGAVDYLVWSGVTQFSDDIEEGVQIAIKKPEEVVDEK